LIVDGTFSGAFHEKVNAFIVLVVAAFRGRFISQHVLINNKTPAAPVHAKYIPRLKISHD